MATWGVAATLLQEERMLSRAELMLLVCLTLLALVAIEYLGRPGVASWSNPARIRALNAGLEPRHDPIAQPF